MRVLAIDPGDKESAWLVYNPESPEPIVEFDKGPNELLLTKLRHESDYDNRDHFANFDRVAIEMIASYGMPVGREVFETCVWIGRFIEAWGGTHTLVYRKDVKLHLCQSMRAKDGNVAKALRDRFGGKGTKQNPGGTYGISGDVWSALAVAVTYSDMVAVAAA